MRLTRTIFALLCAAARLVQGDEEDGITSIPLRTHCLDAPYLDSELQSRWWDYGGDTIIRADSYVRLTGDLPSRKGWIWSRVPLTATNWEVEVEFQIHGKGHLYGDGFAIWLTKQRAELGTVFGAPDKFEGLGIFFDTYKNNRPGTVFPYVMAMIGDGNTAYDQSNDGKANELGGCSARGIRNAGTESRARLRYFKDRNLTMDLQYKDEDQWERCFEVANPTLPQVAYLGFSAETGQLSDNHDIVSVQTRNIYEEAPSEKQTASKGKGKKAKSKGKGSKGPTVKVKSSSSSGGSWSWFLLKVVLFFLVCGGGYVGFTVYRSQRRGSRF